MNRVLNQQITISGRAQQLHKQLLIADLHADSLLFGRNLLVQGERGQVDIPRLKQGNVALQMFTVVTKVPRHLNFVRNDGRSDSITLLAIANRWLPSAYTSLLSRAEYQARNLAGFESDSRGQFVIIRDRNGLERFFKQRKAGATTVAGILGLEGAHALEGNVGNVDSLYDSGFRVIGLAHFFDNEFAGSAHGAGKGGLTSLGRELIEKLENRRMNVDLSHSSPKTIEDVLRIAKRPLLVSHTGVRGTCDNQRNLSDQQLAAISQAGGLIGIAFFETAVCGKDAAAIVRAIRHAVDVAGIDHVALGSDFDGAVTMPFDTTQVVAITDELLKAGFTEIEIRKIMGENTFRFFAANLP
jgi:membrane dipeptidase